MEIVKEFEDSKNLVDNKIIGSPEIKNSEITFIGTNNILVCNNNTKISNSKLIFKGNNSIVFLSSDLGIYFNLIIYNNSTVYSGKDVLMGHSINFNIQEGQNIIIGDDCIIGNKVNIFTSDNYPIYDIKTKSRINYSDSVFIGDHVWLGRFTYVSKGVKIGSGSIIYDKSVLPQYMRIKSNSYLLGNPARIIKDNVFFVKDYVGNFKSDDSLNSEKYISDVFVYHFESKETLDLNKLDNILKELSVLDRLDFIKKLFLKNKLRNRFAI